MKVYQYDDQPVSMPFHDNIQREAYLPFHPQGDLRQPHYSGIDIDTSHLSSLGVAYHTVPTNTAESNTFVEDLAKAKDFSYRDEITYSVAAMGDAYEAANALNNHEHIHDEDEIRYITRGG